MLLFQSVFAATQSRVSMNICTLNLLQKNLTSVFMKYRQELFKQYMIHCLIYLCSLVVLLLVRFSCCYFYFHLGLPCLFISDIDLQIVSDSCNFWPCFFICIKANFCYWNKLFSRFLSVSAYFKSDRTVIAFLSQMLCLFKALKRRRSAFSLTFAPNFQLFTKTYLCPCDYKLYNSF